MPNFAYPKCWVIFFLSEQERLMDTCILIIFYKNIWKHLKYFFLACICIINIFKKKPFYSLKYFLTLNKAFISDHECITKIAHTSRIYQNERNHFSLISLCLILFAMDDYIPVGIPARPRKTCSTNNVGGMKLTQIIKYN